LPCLEQGNQGFQIFFVSRRGPYHGLRVQLAQFILLRTDARCLLGPKSVCGSSLSFPVDRTGGRWTKRMRRFVVFVLVDSSADTGSFATRSK